MALESPELQGRHIRLEPLAHHHIDGLVAAAAGNPGLYQWSPVPQGRPETIKYVEKALAWRDAGTAVPFAIVRIEDGSIIGSTRFFEMERWFWPPNHPLYGRGTPDVCEIGYTWLSPAAIRTATNTEAKLLMLTHAFESWKMLRVCFHTDVRNQRSRAAIERIGGHFEGILRAHRMASDYIPRDSVRYSIIASEWPGVKERLSRAHRARVIGLTLGSRIALDTAAGPIFNSVTMKCHGEITEMPPATANGKICYIEIPATDIVRSADFYKRVFGWNVRTRGDGSTAFDDTTGQVSGSWVLHRPPAAEPGLLVYIMVDSVAKTMDDIVANGGKIVQPIGADAPQITARFLDPGGNVIGLYQQSA